MIIDGKEVTWSEISREQLKYFIVDKNLTNSTIAKMFGVTASKVQYKKSKFNLTGVNYMYECFVNENKALFDELNGSSKEWFSNHNNIDFISKAITQYIFRNGYIETVHSKCKDFTDEDMKKVNIDMVNHIAGLLTYALAGNWLQLRILLDYFYKYGSAEWQPAKAETNTIDHVFYRNFNLKDYEYNVPV